MFQLYISLRLSSQSRHCETPDIGYFKDRHKGVVWFDFFFNLTHLFYETSTNNADLDQVSENVTSDQGLLFADKTS